MICYVLRKYRSGLAFHSFVCQAPLGELYEIVPLNFVRLRLYLFMI
jgi:hypothetical protein